VNGQWKNVPAFTIHHLPFTIHHQNMSARLTVIFYIILCLEVGLALTFLPWIHVLPFLPTFGLSDWGDNYFLLYASHKTGLQGLQSAVSSGWVRGAVTGLGLLNLTMAFWEMAHFSQIVRALQGATANTKTISAPVPTTTTDAVPQLRNADSLSHLERRDDAISSSDSSNADR
jgi:hypothetical protein